MSYFPTYCNSKNKTEIELDLSNYATKSYLKNAVGVDTSQFAKNTDLASLKTALDKLGVDELKNVPTYLTSSKNKVDLATVGNCWQQLQYLATVPED